MRRLPAALWFLPVLALAGCGDPVVVDVAGRTMQQLARGTRAQRLEALAQIPAFEFVPPECEAAILECLADADPAVRIDAAEALRFIGEEKRGQILPAVEKALGVEADPAVKKKMQFTLKVLGGAIKETSPRIVTEAPVKAP